MMQIIARVNSSGVLTTVVLSARQSRDGRILLVIDHQGLQVEVLEQLKAVRRRGYANLGSPDVSVGGDHAAARPGRGGQSPPRVRSAMAMRDSGLRP